MSTLKIISLINVLCFVLIESQRGGGSSGGSSGGSRRSSYNSYSSNHYYGTNSVHTQWGWSDFVILGGIILIMIPVVACVIISEQKK